MNSRSSTRQRYNVALAIAIVAIAGISLNPSRLLAADTPTARTTGTQARLVALLPMRDGYSAEDHDKYERRIAPIAADHGMVRDSAYSVQQFLGGPGPKNASTLGVWTLGSPEALQAVMSDARYKVQMTYRDRIHDMPNAAMYLAREIPASAAPEHGHALLAGVLAMQPGFDYADHAAYEKAIGPIMARHGMRLVRTFQVTQPMGGEPAANIVAVSLWDLPTTGALGEVMSDPEYKAIIGYRDRIHDMAATTMYFIALR